MSQHHAVRRTTLTALAAAAVGLLATAACSDGSETPTAASLRSAAPDAHALHARINNGDLTPAQKKAIAQVRNATARFHDLAVADAAGYDRQFPLGCAFDDSEAAAGAQGYHFINDELVDGNVELLRPELVMYEPGPGGTRRLVGVDYVVPLTMSVTPPTLLGVPFMRNDLLGVWALHIWAWRPNPVGMFEAWNLNVSCEHADPV